MAGSGHNTTSLAFLGDAAYELFVREKVLDLKKTKPQDMSRAAVRYVRAPAQALAAKKLLEGSLSDEETKVLKRGRNNTRTATPRGATPTEYKLATGLETLIGHLYITGQNERLKEICSLAMAIIDEDLG